jgi:DNA polymerase III delta prime subunit
MKKFQTNRKFSNLFGPEIDVVKKRVGFFIKNKKWYDEKGIPYTIGLLLSGQAGAGKTSTVKCLANETNRHVININLNNDITKTQFENLFFNEVISVLNTSTGQTEKYSIPLDQRIYVLEDIDCQSDLVMERSLKNPVKVKNEQQEQQTPTALTSIKTNPNKPDTYNNNPTPIGSEKLDLSFLLNILDGVLEIPGRIVIMTSNYIDTLDHALIRPGRIDIIANFKKCVNTTLIQMIEFFYDVKLTENDKKRILGFNEYIVSPAEMGKVMFENFDDYRNTIETLEKMHRNHHPEKCLSPFYSNHGQKPVHDNEDDHKYQMAVNDGSKTEVEKEERENEENMK